MTPVTVTPIQALPAATAAAQDDSDVGFSFKDLIDMVNPLQHIPIVGTLYRHITGDTINTVPKIAGDTLYGGLEGFAGSVADTIFEKITGKSFGDTVYDTAMNLFDRGSSDAAPATTAVASNNEPSLLDRIENFFSSSPAVASGTAVASNAPIDTTATPVASDAPALSAPAVVADASLETLVVPGQDMLFSALRQVGTTADATLRGSSAYQRAALVHTRNVGAQIPALRATLH
ncbi:MAG: hypothetical protein ISQ86_10705 [Alphaproteobacteria bacterium]|nr:hypothetical protein [Alphaproteobacteria bacterium]